MNQGKFRVEIRLRHSVHTMGLRSISCVGRVVVLVAAAVVARAALFIAADMRIAQGDMPREREMYEEKRDAAPP